MLLWGPQGYLAALSASAYSYVSMLQRFGPLMNRGGAAVSLTYLASERIVPGAAWAASWRVAGRCSLPAEERFAVRVWPARPCLLREECMLVCASCLPALRPRT